VQTDTILLNDITYEFTIILRNDDRSIVLPKNIFQELYIGENFMDWNTQGYLIYENSFEQLERYKEKSKVKNSEFFYYRMDGTDEIIIKLVPVLVANTDRSKKALENFPVDKMTLKFRGGIYDSEDLSKSNIESKLKKLYFRDLYYHKADNMNVRVSCGEYMSRSNFASTNEEQKDVSTLSNTDRLVANGDLINYILTDKLEAPVSTENWDSGVRTTFYVSNPTTTVRDDIQYLLSDAFASDGYPLWFNYDRYNEEFFMVSYKTLFDNYPTSLKERFQFSDPTKPNTGVVPSRSDSLNTYTLPGFSNILSYKYNKMSANDNIKCINSKICTGYDNIGKRFLTNAERAHITTTKAMYTGLLDSFPSGNRNSLFVINQDKISNMNPQTDYVLEASCSARKTVEAALMLNDAIHFEVQGLASRNAGDFIEIESDTDTEGIWEDRFLGTWLIIDVRHKITPQGYTNQILAIKPNMSEAFTYPDGTEVEKQNIETVQVN
jgi:hypothetical protein